jgi:uncharacterized zinc-type alcohol dehydrogenase-like protein
VRRTTVERRDLRPDDLAVQVDFWGVCHSDLHALHQHDPHGSSLLVPGHEFTGVVTEIGNVLGR